MFRPGTGEMASDRDAAGSCARVDDESARIEREVTTRLARGTVEHLRTDPLDLAHWLVGVAPRSTLDPGLDLDVVPDAAIVIADDGSITRANRRALEMSGYDAVELIGTRIGYHISGQAPDTTRLHRRDGREVSIELLVCPAAAGSSLAMLRPRDGGGDRQATAHDQDVAEIVHDLKAPLSTILLEAAALRIRLEDAGLRDATEPLARIDRNVDFMNRLVHDLLDLALVDAGQLALQRRTTEVVALVADVLGRVVSTRDRGRVVFEAVGPIVAEIDDHRIGRVVANLVGNATKYAPRDGCITVTVVPIVSGVRVSVTDTGPGLTADDARSVFDKFRRTRSAGKHHGTGLGLYVSRRMVEAHGGHLAVEPVGTGSRFYFELPLA